MAETLTEKLRLAKRDTGDLNWGAGHNSNLDLLDTHLQHACLRPPRTLLATLGAGAVGAQLVGNTIYFYKVTAVNAAGETTENKYPAILEAQINEPVSPVPVVLQWEIVKGATAYRVYKSTVASQEKLLAEVTGESNTSYMDTGNTATNPLTPVPAQNSARTSVSKIIAGTGVTISPPDGTGDVTINASGAGGGVTTLRKTGEANGLSGHVSLDEGAGIDVVQDGPNNKLTIINAGVTGLRKLGEAAPLVGDVKFEAGSNVTLTQDVPNNKIVIAAAGGGGGGGYATAVVPAPSGNAATDTSNIQTALTAIGTLGRGRVVLREGTYEISSTLLLSANTTLEGQGRDQTILLGHSSLGAVPIIDDQFNVRCRIRHLTVDCNNSGRTGNPSQDVNMQGNFHKLEGCLFTRGKGSSNFIRLGVRSEIRDCHIQHDGDFSQQLVMGGDIVENCRFVKLSAQNLTNFLVSALQVRNCRFLRQTGSLLSSAVQISSFESAIGNHFSLGVGVMAIFVSNGATGAIANDNVSVDNNTIQIASGCTKCVAVGNANMTITNSGGGTNIVASNS